MFGHDVFSHFYAEGDSAAMMTNARWKDWSVEKYDYAKYDDDGIYQARSFFWNLCGGKDYEIAQAVHQYCASSSCDAREDGVVPKKEKIVTWIRDYTGNTVTNGSMTFETIKTFTHTQHYHFPMKNTATATYYNQSCEPELDSMEGEGARVGCFTDHNRNVAANDQARKAIKWLEDKYPDKVCTGDEKIYTPAEWDKVVESQQDEDENGDEDATEVAEEPDNTKLYLIIGGVVVIGGIVAYQMSQG